MKLTVLIPVRNQSQIVYDTIVNKVIPFFDAHPWTYDVLVVYDGSNPEQKQLLEDLFKKLPLQCKLVDYEDHSGKGHNVQKGFLNADGDYVLMMDADCATDLACMDLIGPELGKYDAYLANRDHKDSIIKKRPFFRQLGHNGSVWIIRHRFGLKNIHDTQCGFKIYRTSIAKEMAKRQILDGFAYDVEHCYFLAINGFKTMEFPVHWENDDEDSTVHFKKEVISFYKDLNRVKKNKKAYILNDEERKAFGL